MPQLLYNGRFDPRTMKINAEDLLADYIHNEQGFTPVIVVPTVKILLMLKKKFIKDYFEIHGKPCCLPRIFTLRKLIDFVLRKIKSNDHYRIITNAYYSTLIEEAISEADLKFFGGANKRFSPALVDKIGSIIYGLKEDGILPTQLEQDILAFDPNKKIDRMLGGVKDPVRLRDINEVYKKYQSKLVGGLMDFPESINHMNSILGDFLEQVKQSNASFINSLFPSRTAIPNLPIDKAFERDSIVLFDGFSEFKEPEIKFLSYFAYSEFPVAINLDYTEYNGPLFGNLAITARKLIESGFDNKTVMDNELLTFPNPNEDIKLPPSVYLRRWLFNTENEIRNPNFYETVKVISAPNRLEECRHIAKIIYHFNKVEHVKLSDICVCMRMPQLYSSILREVFSSNGIPANITDRFELASSQVVTTIVNVIETVVKRYDRSNLFKLLSSNHISKFKDEGIDNERLAKITRELRIFGGNRRRGKEQWVSAIQNRIKLFEFALSNENFADDREEAELKKRIIEYQNGLKDFERIVELIDFDSDKMHYTELSRLIKTKIIRDLGIRESIIYQFQQVNDYKNKMQKSEFRQIIEELEKDSSALHRFLDVLDELVAVSNERNPNIKIKAEEFLKKLRIAISNEKYQVKEKTGLGVMVTSIEQTRGVPYKVLILCGANDGVFPLNFKIDSTLGKVLPNSEKRHIEAEKILFYQFLTNNPKLLDSQEQRIFITYAETDNNRDLVASSFINSFAKISTINLQTNLPEGYLNQVYDINNEDIGRRLEWFDYITEKRELLTLFAQGAEIDSSFISPEVLREFGYLAEIDEIIKNIISITGVDFEKLSTRAIKHLSGFTTKEYSISELENYASCSYKYFIEKILRLIDREKDSEEITPLERGSLLHGILYKFYKKLKENAGKSIDDLSIVELNPENRELYKNLLLEITLSELELINWDSVYYSISKREFLGTDSRSGLLEKWLDYELTRVKDSRWVFHPGLFEFAFGKSMSKHTVKLDSINLRGKIDRVEFDNSMKNFIIADYKTTDTTIPKTKEIKEGKKFQIPVYIAVMEYILESVYHQTDIKAAGGMYYYFKSKSDNSDSGNYKYSLLLKEFAMAGSGGRNFCVDYDDLQNQIQNSIATIKTIVANISNAKFSNSTENSACMYCNFHSICRIKDNKTKMINI